MDAILRSAFDWGCGSGIAARRVHFIFRRQDHFDSLSVWDHSPVACDFAVEAAAKAFPWIGCRAMSPRRTLVDRAGRLARDQPVLNELTPEALSGLRALVARAEAVLWVEPGTHASVGR